MLFSVSHNQKFTLKALLCKKKALFFVKLQWYTVYDIIKFSGSGLLKKQKTAPCISIYYTNTILIIRKLYHFRIFLI